MFKILDRYLVREIVLPFALALVVFTFVLEIPPILQQAESLIAKGVEWSVVFRVLLTLLPQALSVTIPMAVLVGILVGFARLSADREFVAMQACGVSLMRLLRPIAVVAAVGTAATAYETIVALPDANQTFREIAFGVVKQRVESNVRPRVFFEDFPNRVIYVRDLPAGGGWRDVFLADMTRADYTTVYFAREGRILIDREKQLVHLRLIDGTSHTTIGSRPEAYEGTQFESITISVDPKTVFPPPPSKGAPEMSFAELRASIAQAAKVKDPAYSERFMIQQKFSLPATCPILALIALAIGATNRKDGRFASFALGLGVIVVYYILLYGARSFAMGGRLSPEWAPWIPNILMASAAIVMLAWRARWADHPICLSLPVFWRRAPADAVERSPGRDRERPRVVVVIRVPHLNLPTPRLLDLYIGREYIRMLALGLVSLLALFYISTLIDLVPHLFRGEATTGMLLRYFYFRTPQFVYFVIPMSVLVSTLVTVGVMTKNSELMVMRACGISLYRTAAPLLLFALAASAFLYGLQEQVLADANRQADRLERVMRRWPALTSPLDRRWAIGGSDSMYHYDFFDPRGDRFSRLHVYRVDPLSWKLQAITYAAEATPARQQTGREEDSAIAWTGRQGWYRELTAGRRTNGAAVKYTPFAERELWLEPPTYFRSETPDPDMMTFGQLRDFISRLEGSGADGSRYLVALQRKIAFPFVTVIMTLLAVPFAVSTGRRGALYGIGVGIVIAIVYWVALSVFAAFGTGGVLPPTLAAWAPNLLFGAVAAYLVLTVRT
jgi:LPS export ABC transporter permease LptF/LPS export ABC transporter permease LptG